MSPSAPHGEPNRWRDASLRLARRVERRSRQQALLTPLGRGLTAGALAGLCAHLLGQGAPLPMALAAAGALAGLLSGARSASRAPTVSPFSAAWALDRLGGLGERGLVAAGDDRFAPLAPPPPAAPRLLPPQGLPLVAAGLVLGALLFVLPQGARGREPDGLIPEDGAARPVAVLAGPGAGGEPAAARERTEALATEAGRVRTALGLTASEGQDASAVAERLNDPTWRAEARAAADPGSPLGQALAGEAPAAQDVARHLGQGSLAAERLAAQRRADLERAARAPLAFLPPERRALVERYAAARARLETPR